MGTRRSRENLKVREGLGLITLIGRASTMFKVSDALTQWAGPNTAKGHLSAPSHQNLEAPHPGSSTNRRPLSGSGNLLLAFGEVEGDGELRDQNSGGRNSIACINFLKFFWWQMI